MFKMSLKYCSDVLNTCKHCNKVVYKLENIGEYPYNTNNEQGGYDENGKVVEDISYDAEGNEID